MLSGEAGVFCSLPEEDVIEKKINTEQVQSFVWKDFRNLHMLYVVFSKVGSTIEFVSKSEEEAEVLSNQ